MTLGEYLKERRNLLGMSQREVAGRAEITHSHLGLIEKDRTHPSRTVCIRLANVLGVSKDDALKLGGHYPADAPAELEPEEWALIGLYRKSSSTVRAHMMAAWDAVEQVDSKRAQTRNKRPPASQSRLQMVQ